MSIWENKKFLSRPLLIKNDGPIQKQRRWYRQFYTPPSLELQHDKSVGSYFQCTTAAPAAGPTAVTAIIPNDSLSTDSNSSESVEYKVLSDYTSSSSTSSIVDNTNNFSTNQHIIKITHTIKSSVSEDLF